MRVFGHRGASARCPENTRAAFEAALRGGVDGVECDLHLLRDGTVVVLHDSTLRRTATTAHPVNADHESVLDVDVSQLTWEQVKDVDIGAYKGQEWRGQTLLRIEDFLDMIRIHRRSALVELKGTDDLIVPAVAAATAAIEKGLPTEAIHWISFNFDLMAGMKRHMPVCSAFHIAVPDKVSQCHAIIDAAADAGLDGVDLGALPDVVTPDVISYARNKAILVGVWVSVNLQQRTGLVLDTEANWTAFSDRGATFFTSDLPDSFWKWHQQHATPHVELSAAL